SGVLARIMTPKYFNVCNLKSIFLLTMLCLLSRGELLKDYFVPVEELEVLVFNTSKPDQVDPACVSASRGVIPPVIRCKPEMFKNSYNDKGVRWICDFDVRLKRGSSAVRCTNWISDF